ncbi:MAG: membrane integrity-associated transporter subunit PqiC [Undibacterium sp.]|nr:membrane integrity-associated transporter subunit PqiC [Opitutaceae bacterium]
MKLPFGGSLTGWLAAGRASVAGLGCAALVSLLAGCNIIPAPTADATRYYVLTGPTSGEAGTRPITGALRLGLKNVELAPYLKKGALVVRTGENEVSFPNDARWAEPLEQEILHTLRARLLAAPTVGRVFTQPFPFDEKRDYDVSVRILRCEGVLSKGGKGMAQFAATVELTRGGVAGEVVARTRFVAPDAAWDGKDFARLAAELSAAVAALSQEVVAALPPAKS